MQREFDVLVIGELNMDLILGQLNTLPQSGKEVVAPEMNMTLGSSSAIFASNVARLGMKTAFCGMAGQDNFGKTIIETLKQNKVDTHGITSTLKYNTGLTVVLRTGDDRAMITYPGAMAHFSEQDIPDEVFRKARHLHISSVFLQPGIKQSLFEIIDKAKSHNLSVSIDTQWDPAEKWDIDLKRLLPQIDFFLPNEAEFKNMTTTNSVTEGLKQAQGFAEKCTVVVKCGKNGAIYLDNNTIKTIPGHANANVVDTVGAGDSFNAGLIYKYLLGAPLESCVKFATITGAVSTTQPGGTRAIKSLGAVEDIAKTELLTPYLNEFTK